MPFLGKKTPEVIEVEMFSYLNMILKRDFYIPEKIQGMRKDLKELCAEYVKLN